MTATRLKTRALEKVWGKHELPRGFAPGADRTDPIGEIWFEDPAGRTPELLVKYLLTSEKLSIQVHPGNEAARAAGHASGKDEAWLILDAEPGARIGLGLKSAVSKEELRSAALDGRIEEMVDWREAKAGDLIYSPAGTIHAIGPGLTLIEIQQNVDVTYRLYDYGRPRELHLDEAIEAAHPGPYAAPCTRRQHSAGREILADCPSFVLERWTAGAGGMLFAEAGRPVWLIPVSGGGVIDRQAFHGPGAWLIDDRTRIRIDEGSEILFAYPGSGVVENLIVQGDADVVGLPKRSRFVPPANERLPHVAAKR
jgi:mannose-6-phosphate isomerase